MEIRNLMRKAYMYALRSDDESTKLGSLLWHPSRGVIAYGCNHFVPGYGGKPEHHERPLKYSITEHAERDVIYKASDVCVSLNRCILVCPWVACPDCARAIVLCGIKDVICHKQCMSRTPERWNEMVNLGLDILHAGGVEVKMWSGNVELVKNLNNGEIWYP